MDDMNSMVPAARLEHVRFSYDNGVTWVLDGIDLTIRSGEKGRRQHPEKMDDWRRVSSQKHY